ncbi:hypothetical protein [Bacillus sp. FJAT-22090]|uniref:hypothetical protein n=1 Tax=Bacillus sp. FJAT-22090 TaxID=1581038 RepID=UPI000A4DA88D|nr:hypothetical protein [Bacillus sp. FJAT-22090]
MNKKERIFTCSAHDGGGGIDNEGIEEVKKLVLLIKMISSYFAEALGTTGF